MLFDQLRDIIKHTQGLGFLEMVKVIGTDKEAKIESIDNDKTVIMYGQLYQPIKNIETTIGLTRLNVLKGYLDYQSFSNDNSTVKIITDAGSDGYPTPTGIEFRNSDGDTSIYRFMNDKMINEQ